jgi:ABC-type uncharacterized transport system substrate-binding protein
MDESGHDRVGIELEILRLKLITAQRKDAAVEIQIGVSHVPERAHTISSWYALFVAASVLFTTRRAQLAVLSARYVLPTAYSRRSFVEAGGLMSYGTDIDDAIRQAGLHTARILKGANPADLPVMRSTKLEFAINLNTADALGIDVPPTLLPIADAVIE